MKTISVFSEHEESVNILDFGKETNSTQAHWGKGIRDHYIVHYIYSGEGLFNGVRVKERQGFLTIPNQLVQYSSSKSKPWKYVWIILDGIDAERILHQYIHTNEHGVFDYHFDGEISELFEKIVSERAPLSKAKALSYFWYILSQHEKESVFHTNGYISEAKKYMQTNYYRCISITEIAKELNISDRYLYNLFIKYENISPKKYLNKIRLEKACMMLRDGNHSITDTAISIGFPDVLAFSKFFSKNMGISPTGYQKCFR